MVSCEHGAQAVASRNGNFTFIVVELLPYVKVLTSSSLVVKIAQYDFGIGIRGNCWLRLPTIGNHPLNWSLTT
jgi:hypothetical protein